MNFIFDERSKAMDILDVIKNRRSIRKFKDKEIPDLVMKEIITAGQYAPSAGNARDFEFIVIDDKELMKKIPSIHEYAHMVLEADKVVIVCANLKKEKYKDFFAQDCSAAVQNMMLAAHFMGIGSVWCGLYPNENRIKAFREMFKIPSHVIPFALCPFGYPNETKTTPDRFDEQAIFYNVYKS